MTSNPVKPPCFDEASEHVALYFLERGVLSGMFKVLANRSASPALKRHEASAVTGLMLPFCVALDKNVFSSPQLSFLAHGFWDAVMASKNSSRSQKHNMVMWQKAHGALSRLDGAKAVDELCRVSLDKRVEPDAFPFKAVAAMLSFDARLWQPQLWGDTPLRATMRFNRAANRVKALLYENDAAAIDLKQQQKKLAEWRRSQKAAI